MENKLADWLSKKLKTEGWSMREVARRSQISHTTIADVLSHQRLPTFDFCAAIAPVVGEPPEKLFRLAGLLPSYPDSDLTIQELADIIRNLPLEKQKDILWYASSVYDRSNEEEPSSSSH
jgi:transcriptional regulator with XRE-family HTH domain